jgi:hypothetical protein
MAEPIKTFTARIVTTQQSPEGAVPLPFDPKEVFGKEPAQVVVRIGKHSYRATAFIEDSKPYIPLAREHQLAAKVEPGHEVEVALVYDVQPRVFDIPDDLDAALKVHHEAGAVWEDLSTTHRKQYIDWLEESSDQETRKNRLDKIIERLTS